MDLQTAPKAQPLTRPTLDTETTPNDYDFFVAKWERYRDGCLKPLNPSASTIAMHLLNCCPQDLQAILRSHGINNESTEKQMLAKIKAITVNSQNLLVNVTNFLRM